MQIRKDFNNLMQKFQRESAKNGRVDLMELFKDAIRIFDKLKDALKDCSEEEKKELFQVMGEMHQFLQSETKKIAEKSGMNEEQLLRYSENPDNFSPSQWKAMEVVKIKLNETGKELTDIVRKRDKKNLAATKKTKADASTSAKKPKPKAKDKWVRS